jgi:hypothetical protein
METTPTLPHDALSSNMPTRSMDDPPPHASLTPRSSNEQEIAVPPPDQQDQNSAVPAGSHGLILPF